MVHHASEMLPNQQHTQWRAQQLAPHQKRFIRCGATRLKPVTLSQRRRLQTTVMPGQLGSQQRNPRGGGVEETRRTCCHAVVELWPGSEVCGGPAPGGRGGRRQVQLYDRTLLLGQQPRQVELREAQRLRRQRVQRPWMPQNIARSSMAAQSVGAREQRFERPGGGVCVFAR